MNGIIGLKFPGLINRLFTIFYTNDQTVSNSKRRLFFVFLIILNSCELCKNLFNGFVNSYIYRLYLFNFICTTNSSQIIFDFSFALTFLFMLRLNVKMLINCGQNDVLNAKKLNFLQLTTVNDLIREHLFEKKDALDYFKMVNFLVKFLKFNLYIFIFGILVGVIRVAILAYHGLNLTSFLFISLPNGLILTTTILLNYCVVGLFYTVYWLDCIFLHKKLTSLSVRMTNSLIKKNDNSIDETSRILSYNDAEYLNQLNQILKHFYNQQKEFNLTLATYFIGISVVGYTFPFIYLFNSDDQLNFLFCIVLYIHAMYYSIYSIILASSFLNNGVNIKKFFKKKIKLILMIFKKFEKFRNQLYLIILRTEMFSTKLKLGSFLYLNMDNTFMGYNYLNSLFNYSHPFLYRVIFRSNFF